MPRKPRAIRSFPEAYLDMTHKAMRNEQIDPIIQPSKRQANALRLDINRFRTALLENGHPGFEAMRDLVLSVDRYSSEGDEHILQFTPRGFYKLAQELKGEEPLKLDAEGLPDIAPQPMSESQEEIFKRLYGWSGGMPGDKDKDKS